MKRKIEVMVDSLAGALDRFEQAWQRSAAGRCQHNDLVAFDQKEERVREAPQHRSTNVTLYPLVQLRVSLKMRLGPLNVLHQH